MTWDWGPAIALAVIWILAGVAIVIAWNLVKRWHQRPSHNPDECPFCAEERDEK